MRVVAWVGAVAAACSAGVPQRVAPPPPDPPAPVADASVPEIVAIRVYLPGLPLVRLHGLTPRSCDERPVVRSPNVMEPIRPGIMIRVDTANVPRGARIFLKLRVASHYTLDRDGTVRCDQYEFSERTDVLEREVEGTYYEDLDTDDWPCHVEIGVRLVDGRNAVLARRAKERFSIGGDSCR